MTGRLSIGTSGLGTAGLHKVELNAVYSAYVIFYLSQPPTKESAVLDLLSVIVTVKIASIQGSRR